MKKTPAPLLPISSGVFSATTQRRDFVRGVVGLAGSAMLGACGGGGAAEPADAGSRLSPGTAPSTPPAAANPANTLRVSLPSGSETNYPLQFGRAFLKGEIRRSPQVLLDGALAAQAQVDVKTRHEDGSVRFAVVSVVLPSLSTTERVITFADSDPPAGSPEAVANMLANYDFEATIRVADRNGVALVGSPVSARTMLGGLTDAALAAETTAGGTGPRYWTQGSVCTTVLLHDHDTKSFDFGTNATKAIRPLFVVQFWPSIKRFHVRHILEISDVTKLKEETGLQVVFATGRAAPAERLNQVGVNLFTGSFASRAYWGGTPVPRANVKHSLQYLASVGVVPNFDPSIAIRQSVLTSYAADWESMNKQLGAVGYWQRQMSAPGGRPDLGVFPKWDVLALYSGDSKMHEIAEGHAEFAGWWNIHAREGSGSKTIIPGVLGKGRVLSKMAGGRPTTTWAPAISSPEDALVVDGPLSNRDGWAADDSHTPGLYFFQYLTTGSCFWHEKVLQLASFGLFFNNPGAPGYNSVANGRRSSDMILNVQQVRAFGWQMRNRVRSWWAALDSSPEKALFTQAMEDALAQRAGLYDVPGYMVGNGIRDAWNTNHALWWNSKNGGMVRTPRPNGMNWPGPGAYLSGSDGFGLPSDGAGSDALWMQNYCVVSLFHAVELGYELARPLADWFAKPVIAIANSTEPRHLGDYVIPTTKADGTFYQSPQEIWSTYAHNADAAIPTSMPPNPSSGFSAAGTVNTSNVTVEGYGSISAGAIAMANGVGGASTAWTAVQPWHTASAFYDHDPRWAIIPRR
jgi:hypothetical protein